MIQVAAALLFIIAAGLGLVVILGMLKNNETAILSALLGEGAFAAPHASHGGPRGQMVKLRCTADRRECPRPFRAAARTQIRVSRAA